MSIRLRKYLKSFGFIIYIFSFCFVFVIQFGHILHSNLLRLGENLYQDQQLDLQYSYFRIEPQSTNCERVKDIDTQVSKLQEQYKKDEFVDIFGTPNESDIRESVLRARQLCLKQYQAYDKQMNYLEKNPSLRMYRNIEVNFFRLYQWSILNRFSIFSIFLMSLVFVFYLAVKSKKNQHI